jgi:Secretion system C-terminal sorting domain
MLKKIILLIFFEITFVFSQNYDLHNTKYDEISEEISSRNSYQREKWFYEQRIYPNGYIKNGAYADAIIQRELMRNQLSYFDNYGQWVTLGPTPAMNTYYSEVSSRIASVKFHPADPSVIYLAAAFGGIWKTTNSGVNWYPKTDFEVTLSSGAIAIDHIDPEIIYYGTGEATYFTYSYAGSGLLKSTNGGNTWVNYISGLPVSTYFSRIVVNPNNNSILFAALGVSGLYKSTNSGESWFLSVPGRCDDVLFSPDGSRVYCIGSGSGYRMSADSGNTFTPYSPFVLGTRNHIALCKSSPQIIYSAVYEGTTVSVYKSTNAGLNFNLLQNNFTGASQAWYDFYIQVNPFEPDYAYVGLIDLWRTTNGSIFTKITNTSAGPVHVDHHNMDFHPTDPDKLICANDGGVWYSANRGSNWINLNSTLNLTQFYRIASDPGNSSHLIGGTQDNGIQRTTGSPVWNVLIFGGDGGDACFHPVDNNYVLAENQFNRLKRSTNGGVNWQTDTSGLFGRGAWIGPIISHPDSAGIFYTAREQVFKSTDYGDNWFALSAGTTGIISQLSISESEPSIMYASSNSNVFVSTNGGVTFSVRNSGLPVRTVTSFSVHPDSSNTAIVTLSGFGTGHVYRTTDLGISWFNISGNMPDIPLNDGLFCKLPESIVVLVVASDIGVFISESVGTLWQELADGLPNTVAMHLDYNVAYKKLRVATHGRGVWEYNGSLINVITAGSELPDRYDLQQNYPNPFNPVTMAKFQIPKSGFVQLKIFDILGREIAILVNEQLKPGIYEVEWNATDAPSGLYFLKLSSGDFKSTRKMILLK